MAKRRKVNLYLWHRMKKKLVISVISVLCCLAVMAIGVFASTTYNFETTVKSDVDVYIAVVKGDLFVKRSGGVYATTFGGKDTSISSLMPGFTSRNLRGEIITEMNNDFEYFTKIYDSNDNYTPYYELIKNQKVDINVYYPSLEYIFLYHEYDMADWTTAVNLYYKDIAPENLAGKNANVNVSYQYAFVNAPIDDEASFSTEGIEWINIVSSDAGEGKRVGQVKIGKDGTADGEYVLIRCALEYNTQTSGNEGYSSGYLNYDGNIATDDDAPETYGVRWTFNLELAPYTDS